MKKIIALLSVVTVGLPIHAQQTAGLSDLTSERHYSKENGNVYYDAKHLENSWKTAATYRVQTVRLGEDSWRDTGYILRNGRRFRSITHSNSPVFNQVIDSVWYENGQLCSVAEYVEKNIALHTTSYLLPSRIRPLSAAAVLSGAVVCFYPDGKLKRRDQYKAGRLISSTCYDAAGSDEACPPFFLPSKPKATSGRTQRRLTIPIPPVPSDRGPLPVKKVAVVLGETGQISRVEVKLSKKYFSADAQDLAVKGAVYVRSAIASAEEVTSAQILDGYLHPELDEVAMHVVVDVLRVWQPVYIEGQAVTTYFCVPVTFILK